MLLVLLLAPGALLEARPAVRPLWEYASELGLSATQVKQLKTTVLELQETLSAQAPRAESLEAEAEKLIRTNGSLNVIRSRLRQASEIRLEMRMADIEAQRVILEILEADQLKRWRSIQGRARSEPEKR